MWSRLGGAEGSRRLLDIMRPRAPDGCRSCHWRGRRGDGRIVEEPLAGSSRVISAGRHEHDVDEPLTGDQPHLLAVLFERPEAGPRPRALSGDWPGAPMPKRHVGVLGVGEDELPATDGSAWIAASFRSSDFGMRPPARLAGDGHAGSRPPPWPLPDSPQSVGARGRPPVGLAATWRVSGLSFRRGLRRRPRGWSSRTSSIVPRRTGRDCCKPRPPSARGRSRADARPRPGRRPPSGSQRFSHRSIPYGL